MEEKARFEDFLKHVLTVLNENDTDQAYSATRVSGYVRDLFPSVWRRAVSLFPTEWFRPKEVPLKRYVVLVSSRQPVAHSPLMKALQPVKVYPFEAGRGGVGAYLFEPDHVVNPEVGTGYVVLPDDYLKLYSFKMREWKMSARTAEAQSRATDIKQGNRYTRGTKWRPVVVEGVERVWVVAEGGLSEGLLRDTDQTDLSPEEIAGEVEALTERAAELTEVGRIGRARRRVLRYYSVEEGETRAGHEVEEALYIPHLAETPDEIEGTTKLWKPLEYLTAGSVLRSMELTEQATVIENEIRAMTEV